MPPKGPAGDDPVGALEGGVDAPHLALDLRELRLRLTGHVAVQLVRPWLDPGRGDRASLLAHLLADLGPLERVLGAIEHPLRERLRRAVLPGVELAADSLLHRGQPFRGPLAHLLAHLLSACGDRVADRLPRAFQGAQLHLGRRHPALELRQVGIQGRQPRTDPRLGLGHQGAGAGHRALQGHPAALAHQERLQIGAEGLEQPGKLGALLLRRQARPAGERVDPAGPQILPVVADLRLRHEERPGPLAQRRDLRLRVLGLVVDAIPFVDHEEHVIDVLVG